MGPEGIVQLAAPGTIMVGGVVPGDEVKEKMLAFCQHSHERAGSKDGSWTRPDLPISPSPATSRSRSSSTQKTDSASTVTSTWRKRSSPTRR